MSKNTFTIHTGQRLQKGPKPPKRGFLYRIFDWYMDLPVLAMIIIFFAVGAAFIAGTYKIVAALALPEGYATATVVITFCAVIFSALIWLIAKK